ncbi:MAG: tail fiber domain-containing protein [Bacteroidetes bacterium]|nr:tail fiber domain-containing protein [Bacteroidota bacterium]
MKKLLLNLFLLLITFSAISQISVNTDGSTANPSAMLDVKSTSKGILVPRMSTTQRGNISSPATGLLVFDTDENKFYYYDFSSWTKIESGITNWDLASNKLTVSDTNYSIGIGTTTPTGKFEVSTVKHDGSYGSDLCSGGTVTASSSYTTYIAERSVDDNNSTEWLCNNALPSTLQYDLGSGNSKRIAKYRVYYSHPSSYDHSPKDWTFQSSDDGSSWTTLDTQTSQDWTADGWKDYTFSNTTEYQYYRINISDNKGADNNVQINELEIMEESLSSHTTLFVKSNQVGVGTSSPSATLDIVGTMQLTDGNEGDGKILVSDASGNATWADGANVNAGGWTVNGNYIFNTSDSVGIGTSTPDATLTVNGRISQTGTGSSVYLGENAGKNNTIGEQNCANGYQALYSNTTGSWLTAVGTSSLYSNVTGNFNTANGCNALLANTSGNSNTANGYNALFYNTSGNSNTANGTYALYSNTTGKYNVAVGLNSLGSSTTSHSNVAVGTSTLLYNSTISNLVAIGDSALYNNGSGATGDQGTGNTAVGSKSMYNNTTGAWNTVVGYQALYSGNISTRNCAIGYKALFSNTSGDYNVAIGDQALMSFTGGRRNTAVGTCALQYNVSGQRNTAIGAFSMNYGASGDDNVAVGKDALSKNTGDYNVAVGSGTLFENTIGEENAAFGTFSLAENTSGVSNTSSGYFVMRYNTIGSHNSGMGSYSLTSNTTGNNNTASGDSALYSNISGNENCAFGIRSLRNSTGSYNTAVGTRAAYSNSSGEANVAIGPNAMYQNTTGNSNTAIGNWAGPTSGNTGLSNTTALGNYASVTASNTIHIGNTAVTEIAGKVAWSTYSDARFKKNIKSNVPGLDFIMELKPVTYNWDINKLDEFLNIENIDSYPEDGEAKHMQENIQYTGFLAQEVEVSAQNLGYEFSGVVHPQNKNSIYSIRYAEFVVPLVKAVQELANRNDKLVDMIGEQQQMIDLQKQLLDKQIRTLEMLIKKIESLENSK